MLKRCAPTVGLLVLSIALSSSAYAASSSTSSRRHRNAAPTADHAYGLVEPPCSGCAKLPRNFSPLIPAHSMNVALGSTPSTAPVGTWCFILKNGINSSNATVVATVVATASPRRHHFLLESVRWIVGAPDCSPNQIEMQTLGYMAEGGSLVATPSREIAFSFIVN